MNTNTALLLHTKHSQLGSESVCAYTKQRQSPPSLQKHSGVWLPLLLASSLIINHLNRKTRFQNKGTPVPALNLWKRGGPGSVLWGYKASDCECNEEIVVLKKKSSFRLGSRKIIPKPRSWNHLCKMKSLRKDYRLGWEILLMLFILNTTTVLWLFRCAASESIRENLFVYNLKPCCWKIQSKSFPGCISRAEQGDSFGTKTAKSSCLNGKKECFVAWFMFYNP